MKILYVKVKKGMRFVMSEFGFEKYHVRNRFLTEASKFSKSVPVAWVEKGYVSQVSL